jgi:transcriptional regulator with XRE-family HTH domain
LWRGWQDHFLLRLSGVPRSSVNQTRAVLAENVRSLRKQAGWTQEQAADAMEIATRHYQKIEAGDVNVTVATLVRVAKAFGVGVKALFEEGN